MSTPSCCSKQEVKKGPWSAEEDLILINYIHIHGTGKWQTLPTKAGLNRGGKSCRLRWLNYLRPGIVRGNISKDEEDLIIKLQSLVGNRWSLIAELLPGRTDNEIKNYWNTNLAKQLGYAKRPSTSTKKIKSKTTKKKQVKCDQTSEHNLLSKNKLMNQSVESYKYQMVHDHDNGQCSKDNMRTNSTVGSALEEQEVDHDLIRFLMELDMNNFNNTFDQELMTDHHVMMNPRNDQFSMMVEEDQSFNTNVAYNYDPCKNVPVLPHSEPLLMNTNGNGDQIQIEDKEYMMMNCEVASMENTRKFNNLKELASFLDVEYQCMDNI